MWFITLIVLALAAFLIIKAVKAQSNRKIPSEANASPELVPQGQLKRDSSSQNVTRQQSAANDSEPVNTTSGDAPDENLPASATESATSTEGQQDELLEIREMIKILNLAEVDSARLGVSAEQFNALRKVESGSVDMAVMPSRDAQADIADRLRRMLA